MQCKSLKMRILTLCRVFWLTYVSKKIPKPTKKSLPPKTGPVNDSLQYLQFTVFTAYTIQYLQFTVFTINSISSIYNKFTETKLKCLAFIDWFLIFMQVVWKFGKIHNYKPGRIEELSESSLHDLVVVSLVEEV